VSRMRCLLRLWMRASRWAINNLYNALSSDMGSQLDINVESPFLNAYRISPNCQMLVGMPP
jgi:hypothetical protein